jgi:hypothetical protein
MLTCANSAGTSTASSVTLTVTAASGGSGTGGGHGGGALGFWTLFSLGALAIARFFRGRPRMLT